MLFIIIYKIIKRLSKNQKQKLKTIYQNFIEISLYHYIF